jgi:predicted enzyme related to lactoylglutathione lyase
VSEAQHLFAHGRLSYVQIPAEDVKVSAAFYESVFGWQVRGEGTEHLGFSDATGEMIGAWVTGRSPTTEPGVVLYVYVHGIDDSLEKIVANGGEVVRPPYREGDLFVATFRDPGGNVIGVWQQGPR